VTSGGLTRASVFCVDDNAGFRQVLRALVEATPGFLYAGEASSGEEAVMLVPTIRPDVVLMDVHMPGMGGLRAAEILVRAHRGLTLALISVDPIELPPGCLLRGRGIAALGKHELCPRVLLELRHGC
jgi:two-component system, NarL family, invasion response regulator UvrY